MDYNSSEALFVRMEKLVAQLAEMGAGAVLVWETGSLGAGAMAAPGAMAQTVGTPVGGRRSFTLSPDSRRSGKPSFEEGRLRQTTTANSGGRVDRGPRPGLSIPGPQNAGVREAYVKAALRRLGRRG
uniref:Uncharacterized protein n=1 Tax=Molossus molossus TaxID=27622 RepID=A0A7J8CZH3_MOLMO|nr:hypothetical protein HJG59_009501 [Molossus molossus]